VGDLSSIISSAGGEGENEALLLLPSLLDEVGDEEPKMPALLLLIPRFSCCFRANLA
jgi:hypothetical protein